MKNIYTILLVLISIPSIAQVSSCFEIESILVDACAPPNQEGLNEMVRFKVGPQALNANTLSVTWATVANSWEGVCQSNQTSAIVAELNSSIQSCGIILEPVGNILPANSTVILVSSAQFTPSENSFVALSDTLYILFHCGANTTGNFANYNAAGGLRTLSMEFTNVSGCSDVVSYDRGLLVTSSGSVGNEDGATVEFDPEGNATYVNNGCVAPVVTLTAEWTAPASVCTSSEPLDLTTFITDETEGTWSGEGVSGSIFNPDGLSGLVDITYTVTLGECIVESTQAIQVISGSDASWTTPGELCSSASPIDLTTLITGDLGGTFSGAGVTGNTFNPSGLVGNIELTYTVGSGDCETSEVQTAVVTSGPDVTWAFTNETVCSESTPIDLSLLVTGNQGGTWSGEGVSGSILDPTGLEGLIDVTYEVIQGECSNSLTNSVNVISTPSASWVVPEFICSTVGEVNLNDYLLGTPGGTWTGDNVVDSIFNSNLTSGSFSISYTVGGVGCLDELTRILVVIPAPEPPVILGNRRYCPEGQLPILTSSEGDSTFWYGDENLSNLLGEGEVFQPENDNITTFYINTGASDCISLPVAYEILLQDSVFVNLDPIGPVELCPDESVTLGASSEGALSWSNGQNEAQISVSNPGVYTITATGFCNSSQDSVEVIDASIEVSLELSTDQGPSTLEVVVNASSTGGSSCIFMINGVFAEPNADNAFLFEEGLYTITYECTNSAGCFASVSRDVEVFSGNVVLEFPNSFTPNGDGFNEFFTPQTSALEDLTVTIFNRWGQQVVELNGVALAWDGSNSNGALPDGVYFYVSKAKDIYGNELERKGSITLLR